MLEIEAQEARNSGEPLALALADIDHFKQFNDSFGHQTGDHVLKFVAQTLKQSVRSSDHVARYGGEEFALVLPRTAIADAVKLADKLRSTVCTRDLVRRSTRQPLGTLTLSVGVTVYRPGEPLADFLHRADRCLYAAKQSGRDRVATDTAAEPAASAA